MLTSYTEFYEQTHNKGRENQYSLHACKKYGFHYADLKQLIIR